MGFQFPSIWMGCHVTQIQQVSWDVLSAILGSNNLNESASVDAGRHGVTLHCTSLHPDDKTHGSRYRWLFCIPPCAFFFLWQAERSVWMCLPEAAACWGPEWGAFCLIVIRPDLLLFSLPPPTVSPPALWRRGWCVNSPPLRGKLQLFGANTRKWPTSSFCTYDAQKEKKNSCAISPWVSFNYTDSHFVMYGRAWMILDLWSKIFFAERKRPY